VRATDQDTRVADAAPGQRRGKSALLPIRIDEAGGRTLQEQIYSCIRLSIVSGLIGADRRLPSTRALAADLGVSRTTVLHALEYLKAAGYLECRRGSGTFVARELLHRTPAPTATRTHITGKHPQLSNRGRALAQTRPPDHRGACGPRAFRLGTPALDEFPIRAWSRIARSKVKAIRSARLDYSELGGRRALREAIAEQVRSRGTRCDPQQVMLVAGAQRGLDLIFHLLLDPGERVWMEDPGYSGARSALIAAQADIACIPVDDEGMNVDSIASRSDLDRVRVACVTPSHQFPLGVTMSLKRRRNLLGWARQSQAWIVEDDYDCEFRYQAKPLPCLHALDPDGRVIYVGSFSKTLFPALRLGFLIVPSDLVEGFTRARLASDVHPPVFEQLVLAEFMLAGHYERHLRRMQAVYAERLDALRSAIEHSGAPLKLRPVRSGLHAVADLEGVDAESVCREAAARNLEVMPLSEYYFGEQPAHNALVLGFGSVPAPALHAGVAQLAAAIGQVEREQRLSARKA
jgi:GntR family transcriptional regulator/MocR family aminotransferase